MNEVPEHGYDWVWYRVGRACGDMIWSSDMVQVIIFFKLYKKTLFAICKTYSGPRIIETMYIVFVKVNKSLAALFSLYNG